ncbi:MAG: HAMP domain-containing sensor histidine kinase [Gammaproteobacteria bacterium]|nr:HAMP domain-containing sensor histidine kinase [Gammaproteobacteria bacterium]
MFSTSFIKGYDQNRLRKLLTVFFLALAIPTAALIWQGYSQLKWEAFHQYRGLAEELTNRIDARLIEMTSAADARSFADYSFLVVTGDPKVNVLQRSPLSVFPVAESLPGVLGYFQVDSDGVFSSPLIPPEDADPEELGIGADEYSDRLELTQKIRAVLDDNRLVRSRPEGEFRRGLVASPAAVNVGLEDEQEADRIESPQTRARQFAAEPIREPKVSAEMAVARDGTLEEAAVGGFMSDAPGEKDAIDKLEAAPLKPAARASEIYSQQIFDRLNLPRQDKSVSAMSASSADLDDAVGETTKSGKRLNTIGKVADLKLDADLQKKSEELERKANEQERLDGGRTETPARAKRKETSVLPAAVSPADFEPLKSSVDFRINTFESEIDPLEFSLLDSGHLVLFRKVWRDSERYIQGLLIDQAVFIEDIIETRFMGTALSDMSNAIVAYQDDVIHTISGRDVSSYPNENRALDGSLLYRNRLSAPLNSLELIFSIKRLPPGPGARVLGWTSVVIAIVFLGGFFFLYRLGLSQINLARQQQDFVSAVSHELKTPLTSIRMYGEMLKEGWADEEKRKTYYEYIHNESERLSRLISNVLQLSRITRNEPQFDLQTTKVGKLMSNIESKIANQVEGAGFELTTNRDDETDQASIVIDEDCFAQIVINLVDNAIKFSENADHKAIEIRSKLTSDNQVLFAVRDFGPGIPKDQMRKIFKLFYRSESELTRETVGTGIGLAIVHQLTIAMNGKVDIINREPGAEFRITFPRFTNEHEANG